LSEMAIPSLAAAPLVLAVSGLVLTHNDSGTTEETRKPTLFAFTEPWEASPRLHHAPGKLPWLCCPHSRSPLNKEQGDKYSQAT